MEQFRNFFPTISEHQWHLLNEYHRLLVSWNEKINLVSRKDVDSIEVKHILPVLPAIHLRCFQKDKHVLDVGTGGGIPGIPLAILYPNIHFVLIDSIHKKTKAVEDIAKSLQLKNVEVICDRLENISYKFDVIVGRGVTMFKDFTKLVHPNLHFNSYITYWTGGSTGELLPPYIKKFTQCFDLELFFDHKFCESKKILCYSKQTGKISI